MRNVLVVVDMQNDFISGSLGSDAAKKIVPAVIDKINQYHQKKSNDPYSDVHIVFTQDNHHDNYLQTFEGQRLPVPHCIKRSEGWMIADDIPVQSEDYRVTKPTFGWLHWGNLIRCIAGDTIEIVGLCTDICVVSNALILRAIFPDVQIICDSSCCAGTSIEAHEAALTVMRSCQIDVI